MKKESIIWMLVILAGVLLIVARMAITGELTGKSYVRATDVEYVKVTDEGAADHKWIDAAGDDTLDYDLTTLGEGDRIGWTNYSSASMRDYAAQQAAGGPAPGAKSRVEFSLWNTIGVWVAAFFTLAIFSFLYKDNPLYKIAEAVVVGVSAAYWMVVGFWDMIITNLFAKLYPPTVTSWALPNLTGDALEPNIFYLAPLILGIMLLWRLAPVGPWIARWPLAFIIGTTAGLRLVGFIQADFLSQIRNTIIPVIATSPQLAADGTIVLDAAGAPVTGFDFWDSLQNLIIILGVLTCLVYFFFSIEHKGVVGKTARLGIWFLMITFGAGFGYTVMGRIALLAARIEFLFDDWLWLIDPTGKRELVATVGAMLGFYG